MAIFGGGDKQPSFKELLERVKTRGYKGQGELEELIQSIFSHPQARPEQLVFMLTNPNPTVRELATERFSKLAGRNVCDVLVKAMAECEGPARREIAKEVANTPDEQLTRVLGTLAVSKDAAHRMQAVEIVGQHKKCFTYISLLKRAVKDSDAKIRLAGAQILSRGAKNPTIRMMLLALLDTEDETVRSMAIESLGREPDVDLVEPFFAHMPLVTGRDRDRMADALGKLAENPNSRMEDYVLPVLADENQEMRDAGVRLLAQMPNRTRVLRAYFIHSKGLATWLRSRTTTSILKLADSLVGPLRELMSDDDIDVRVGAMLMISDAEDDSFIPQVVQMFQGDFDWWIRSIAVDVLAKHPSQQIVQLLLTELNNPELRYPIISALGKIGGDATKEPLYECLRDRARGTRIAALEALALDPNERVLERVYLIARDDTEKKVRDKALQLLHDMPGGEQFAKDIESMEDVSEIAMMTDLTMVNEDLNDR